MKLREIIDSDSRKVKNSVTVCAVILFLVLIVSMPTIVGWAVNQIISLNPASKQESTQVAQAPAMSKPKQRKLTIPAGGVSCFDYPSVNMYSTLKRGGYIQHRGIPENINCRQVSKRYVISILTTGHNGIVELDTGGQNFRIWTLESEIEEIEQ